MITTGNLKIIVLCTLLIAAVWFYKDWEKKGYEAKRLAENNAQRKKLDSLKIAYYVYDKEQMMDYVKDNKALYKTLNENSINLRKLETILETIKVYRDTTVVETDFSNVITAINERKPYRQPFKDSTECLVIRGFLEYNPKIGLPEQSGEFGDEFEVEVNGIRVSPLIFSITEKQFRGQTTAVGYWERNLWTIPVIGIKTRLFGKRVSTVKVIDKCGDSQTINITKSK